MRRFYFLIAVLFFASAAFAQSPVGGIQGVPPFPDQALSNTPNQAPAGAGGGCFTSLTGWTVGANVSYDGSTQHTGGCGSAKFVPGSGIAERFQARNISIPAGARWMEVTYWAQVDATYNGAAVVPWNISWLDSTHSTSCCSLPPDANGREYLTVGPGSRWVQVSYEVAIDPAHAGDGSWFFSLYACDTGACATNWTTGNVWVADFTITYGYNAIRSFLLYPNFHGYLWSDVTPPARYSPTVSPVLGQIDGVSELVDPVNTLASDTLTVKMATAAGCASGVLATDTIAAPSATQYWQFKPSAYGTLTVGSTYYLCSKLNVTVGGALVDSYLDWAIVYENPTFRTALPNYVDANGAVFRGGEKTFTFGTYDRMSGALGTGSASQVYTASQTCTGGFTGAQCYENNAQGPGPSTVTPSVTTGITGLTYTNSPNPSPTRFASQLAESDNLVMWSFASASAINPVSGSDQLSPLLDAFTAVGMYDFQIMNNWIGSPINGLAASGGYSPTFNPTPTIGSGSITANYLFLEATAVAYSQGTEGGLGGTPNESLPGGTATNTPISINLSGATCAGTNCSVTFTVPSCPTVKMQGYYIYTATNSVNTAPAQNTFQRQYPTFTGQMFGMQETPCGASVTLSSLPVSGIAPPTVDSSIVGLPTWAVSLGDTDVQALAAVAATMGNASHPGGLAFHIADEPPGPTIRPVYFVNQQLTAGANGILTECVLNQAALTFLYRDVCDVIDVDPYVYGFAPDIQPLDYIYIPAVGGSGQLTCTVYTTNNATATSQNCTPNEIDSQIRETAAAVYGSRPSWSTVGQLYGAYGPNQGTPYALLRQEFWKAFIACKEYGAVDCGVLKWGMVSSLGLEWSYAPTADGGKGNTAAFTDSVTAGSEVMSLGQVLLSPIQDSPILGVGTVLSSISAGTSTATNCGAASAYTNGTNFPYGAFNFVTTTYSGTQYLFVTNLCPGGGPTGSGSNVNLTVNLTSPGVAVYASVYAESRTVGISSNSFTDSFAPFATHIYEISASNTSQGSAITTGVKSTTGTEWQ